VIVSADVCDLTDAVKWDEHRVIEPCVTVPPPTRTPPTQTPPTQTPPTRTASPTQPASVKAEDTAITGSTAVNLGVLNEDRVEPITGIRKAMVKAMSRAQTVPHFGYDDEVRLVLNVTFSSCVELALFTEHMKQLLHFELNYSQHV